MAYTRTTGLSMLFTVISVCFTFSFFNSIKSETPHAKASKRSLQDLPLPPVLSDSNDVKIDMDDPVLSPPIFESEQPRKKRPKLVFTPLLNCIPQKP